MKQPTLIQEIPPIDSNFEKEIWQIYERLTKDLNYNYESLINVKNNVNDSSNDESHPITDKKIEPLLTIDDVSKRCQVSKTTVYGWIYKRQVKPIKINRLVRFDPKEVERWIFKRNGDS